VSAPDDGEPATPGAREPSREQASVEAADERASREPGAESETREPDGEEPPRSRLAQLGRGERVIGVGAVALFVFLFFFDWYGGSASSSLGAISVGASLTGWQSFHTSRWVWLLTIVVALFAVAVAAGLVRVRTRVPLSVIVALLGGLSSLLIAYRIVHHESGSQSGTIGGVHYSSSYGIQSGIWLGLAAALTITAGAVMAMREQGLTLASLRRAPRGGRA
jgi:hypothetical protein